MHHDLFKTVLLTGGVITTTNSRIVSERHTLYTVQAQKLSLSAFDDKRFILDDGIRTLPYGHYSIENEPFFQMILSDDEWGETEEASNQSHGANPHINDAEQRALPQPFSEEGVPDPGFNQPVTTDSDYDDEIADLDEETDYEESYTPNEYLDTEATEEYRNTDETMAATRNNIDDSENLQTISEDYAQAENASEILEHISSDDGTSNSRGTRSTVLYESDSEEDVPPSRIRKRARFFDSDSN